MKLIIRFLSLVLVGIACGINGNPCDGDVFSLGCKMFELIKSNAEKSKVKLEKQFDVVDKHRSDDTREIKSLIADDINKLSSKLDIDIKQVTQLLGDKSKVLKALDLKVNETNVKLDLRTDSITKLFAHKILDVKTTVLQQLGETTSTCKAEVQKFENKIEEHMNVSNHGIAQKFLKIEEEVGDKYVAIETKLTNKINMVTHKLTDVIGNNAAIYKKALDDLKKNLEASFQKISAHNIEKEISQVKADVDTKYKSLKNEVNRNIVVVKDEMTKTVSKQVDERYHTLKHEVKDNINQVTGQLKKTIESEMDRRYHSLKKEINDNIAHVSYTIVKEMNAIKDELKDVKEQATTKGWPTGHYCLLKVKICPSGFYTRKYRYIYYCCK